VRALDEHDDWPDLGPVMDDEREVDYVHDPDDHERAGTDAYTDNLRGGYA
jgi:hypothetical protein